MNHLLNSAKALILGGALSSTVLLPLNAAAADLMETLLKAREQDATFLAAKHEFDATSEAKKQARSALLPNIYYQLERTDTDQDINEAQNAVFNNTSSSYRTDSKGFTVTQTLFNYERFQRYSQSKLTISRAEREFLAAEQDLLMRVAEAYFLVLERTDQLETVQDEKRAMEKHLSLAERKVARGLSRSVDAEDARARYLNALSKEIELESYLMDAKYALREAIGELPETLSGLKEDIALESPVPADPAEWVALAKENNPLLAASRLALKEASKEITSLKGRHYPTLDLRYTDTNRDAGGSLYDGSSDVDTADLSLQLRIPIYAGGGVASQVRQATFAKYRAEEQMRQKEREVERNTVDALRRIDAAIAQIEALEQSVEAQEKMLETKQRGYQSGRFHIIEVLEAQQDLSSARQSLTKARYDYALNTLRLKYESGVLSEQDMQVVNGWLEGNAPYSLPQQAEARPASNLQAQEAGQQGDARAADSAEVEAPQQGAPDDAVAPE